VLWADAAGQWRAFEDRCPHRLATLSDGLVDKQRGEIVCAYHGWRFQVRAAAAYASGVFGWAGCLADLLVFNVCGWLMGASLHSSAAQLMCMPPHC
jgi:hypothetical protein